MHHQLLTDDILRGAIDIHHHSYPEISLEHRMRLDDAAELANARDAGMAGIVLKSHLWPTVGKAFLLGQMVPGIRAWGSLTLNPIAGGFSALAVESAARQGARFVFFPTWGAAHDREQGGFSKHLGHLLARAGGVTKEPGLRVTDAGGRILPEVSECLAVAAEFKLAIGTGHISPRESIALAEAAKRTGIDEIFFQHPDSHSVAASREDIREMARLGAVIELCSLGLLPGIQRIKPEWMVEIIAEVGPQKCVITSDSFFEWAPPAAETLRMTISLLRTKGVPAKHLRTMLRDVPCRLLGIVPE